MVGYIEYTLEDLLDDDDLLDDKEFEAEMDIILTVLEMQLNKLYVKLNPLDNDGLQQLINEKVNEYIADFLGY